MRTGTGNIIYRHKREETRHGDTGLTVTGGVGAPGQRPFRDTHWSRGLGKPWRIRLYEATAPAPTPASSAGATWIKKRLAENRAGLFFTLPVRNFNQSML